MRLSYGEAEFAVYTLIKNAIPLKCNEETMSTLAEHPPEMTMAADDFQALEEKVYRTIDLYKASRQAQSAAERDAQRLRQQLEEREEIRGRVEKMLEQIESIAELQAAS